MVKPQHITAVCLVLVTGLTAYNIFADRAPSADLEPVLAQGSNRGDDVIAFPFQLQTFQDSIAVIAKSEIRRKGQSFNEWHMALYEVVSRRQLKLQMARNIHYDLKINVLNDRSPRGIQYQDLQKRWEEGKPTGDEKAK